jgi:hypothetical protein
VDRFKPPPNITQALVPEVAYQPKKSKPVKTPALLSSASQPHQSEVDEPSGGTSLPSRLTSSRRICWNCNKSGHFISQCRQSKKIFCHVCGTPNKVASRCDCQKRRTPEPGISDLSSRSQETSDAPPRHLLGRYPKRQGKVTE